MTTEERRPGGGGAGRIVAGVVRDFLETTGRTGLHLVGGGPGERALAKAWLSDLVNETAGDPGDPGDPTQPGGSAGPGAGESWWEEESERFRARVAARRVNGEVAHLANRTYLLLAERLPPERVLPLGDVPASTVLAVAGTPLLPAPFESVADDATALAELEAAIDAWTAGSPEVPSDAGSEASRQAPASLGEILRSGFLARTRDRIVPKLGRATPWIDLDY